jgi:CBS domain containing-hemolysin-like protein
MLSNVNLFFAFIILIIIILFGILFDVIGVAVTAAEEVPFHSMASRKVKGSKTAIKLIRNADKVSNFCNDVIGDVCGVISGGTGAVIIGKIIAATNIQNKVILTLAISAIIASITVGGKALGKNFAISESSNIVYFVAWIIESIKKI